MYFRQDTLGENLDLRFYRDKFDREVDFIILKDNKPILLIEAKLTDDAISKGLRYLKSKYPNARALQIHLNGKKTFVDQNNIEHCHCLPFLKELI